MTSWSHHNDWRHETMATRPEQQQVARTMDGVECVLSGDLSSE
ncbi:hypothetical protein LEMLEM_LOCUS16524 [Lemmus lemmus]